MESFDSGRESSFLLYIDQNAPYSYVMQEYRLPTHGFRWLSTEEIEDLNPPYIADDSNVGYTLEVTLKYPENLHDIQAHKDFPLACRKLALRDELLSPLTQSMKQKFHMKTSAKTEKLIPNFFDKRHCVLHYRNLKLYLEVGLQVEKNHRAVVFYQSAWMRSYIKFSIHQRQKATNEFEVSLFKKFNNTVYGKTIENVKNRRIVKLVTHPRQLERPTSKPTFRSCHIIHKKLAGIHMAKHIIRLDKPIYLDFSILELAKLKMYAFHYKYRAKKFGNRARMLYTGTDSYIYQITTSD